MDIVDHETLRRLTRLQLTAIRDQLDSLLDEAAEKKLTLREALASSSRRGVAQGPAHRDGVQDRPLPEPRAGAFPGRRPVRELATAVDRAPGPPARSPGVGTPGRGPAR